MTDGSRHHGRCPWGRPTTPWGRARRGLWGSRTDGRAFTLYLREPTEPALGYLPEEVTRSSGLMFLKAIENPKKLLFMSVVCQYLPLEIKKFFNYLLINII